MTTSEIAAAISPFFPGCPAPLVDSAISWAMSDMKASRVNVPEYYPLVIENGAKFHLYGMPSEPWSDPAMAEKHRVDYLISRGKAKLQEASADNQRIEVPGF